MENLLTVRPAIARAARLPAIAHDSSRIGLAELLVLLGMGALAAVAETQMQFSLRIPGHAILRVVLPMSLGLCLVPRRFSGSLMSLSGMATLAAFHLSSSGRVGTGAMTAMAALGPMLDVAAARAVSGWRLYACFAAAGAAANVLAFGVRVLSAQFMLDLGSGHRFLIHWPSTLLSYLACGAAAGLISAACWFRMSHNAAEPAATRADI